MARRTEGPQSLASYWVAFFSVLLICLAAIASTEKYFPPTVVTKWIGGRAVGQMTRDQWMLVALSMSAAVGLLIAAAGWLSDKFRFRSRRLAQLSPELREQEHSRVRRACLIMASGGTIWVTAFHFIILRANSVSPPRLETWPITLWVIVWIAFVIGFVLAELRARLTAR